MGIISTMNIGSLHKLKGSLGEPVNYALQLDETEVTLNDRLEQKISLKFTGKINCINCKRDIKKSFQNGYCFPCTRKLAACDICMVRPELCHFEDGTCREPEWAKKNCFIPHYVYLANSSGLKVGITRRLPSRWIDQGAVQAIKILKVSNRYHSGVFEKVFGAHVSDKTNWRKMLKGEVELADLEAKRDELFDLCGETLEGLEEEYGEDSMEFIEDDDVVNIEYPVVEYPQKITSLNFDKSPEIEGTLMGVKGQYLILDTGVLNIRKFQGYEIQVK